MGGGRGDEAAGRGGAGGGLGGAGRGGEGGGEGAGRRGAGGVLAGVAAWRRAHPRATLNGLRARLLGDLALASPAAELAGEERPRCPGCGGSLQGRGVRERTVT